MKTTLLNRHFEIFIDCPPDQVYKHMLDERVFRIWSAPFDPTSRLEGNWESGSRMRFIGTNPDGSPGGMVSRVEEHIPARKVVLKHVAVLKGDEETTGDPESQAWLGGTESYTFTPEGKGTRVSVDTEVPPDFEAFFQDNWPKALNILKEICEH